MDFEDDPSDPDWKQKKIKTEPGTLKEHSSSSKPKYSQKFCEKWLFVFSPWLTRCEDDPHKPFCRACQCRLDCNRCHLQRHERTSKHARNLEILVNKGEGAARQNLSIRQERSKYYQQRKKGSDSVGSQEDNDMSMDDCIENGDQENDYGYEQTDIVAVDQYTQDASSTELITDEVVDQKAIAKNSVGRPRKVLKQQTIETTEDETNIEEATALTDRNEGIKLLMQIQKDKTELMDSFKELMGGTITQYSPPREKNHVDLFFESVSSTVKALSPKLIAEAKMRVSQLICELELRALNEESAGNQHQQTPTTTMLVASDASAGTYIINQAMGITSHHHLSQDEDAQQYEALS